ncbi:MAG TPA: GAF and ANTAR domain-containing protein [Mycobacterium sp.]|nr:GAF and ANTAR domain-containing protein [Mycobacterium sp.]
MTTDTPPALAAQLAALVADLHRHDAGMTVELNKLIDSAGRNVPGAQYVGITSAHRQRGVRNVVATHRYAAVLDEIQHHHQQGPCLTAAWEHAVVRINDLTLDERWPHYQRDVLDQTPIRSVLAFELFTTSDAMGALNFYADQPRAFSEDSVELGLVFATNIALAWVVLERNEQFRSALASRDVIGQAKGMIMERYRVDAVQAFELLKNLSQQSNLKLAEVAQRLIETELPR